jgi:heat shock protein beta-11
MANVLKPGTGSVVSYVTSLAPGHPGSDALSEDKKSFWVSTGVFPQELVIRLSRRTPLKDIKILSVNGAQYCVVSYATRAPFACVLERNATVVRSS